jgi:hypothetical protein
MALAGLVSGGFSLQCYQSGDISPSHPFELIFKLPYIDQQLHLQGTTRHMSDIPNEV